MASFNPQNHHFLALVLVLAALSLALTSPAAADDSHSFSFQGNPLVRHMYTADPSARVFDGRLYMYTSHDQDNSENDEHFDMLNWHVFSTDDLKTWTDHGAFFDLEDISWASKQAWAPDAVKVNDKYYFYYPVEQSKIGVAVSDSPISRFVDALDRPLIDNTNNEAVVGREPIDPAVLIDDDGQAYLFFGCRDARYVKLNEDMISLDGDIKPLTIMGITDDRENTRGYYGEAPWVFKRNAIYYLVYANGWAETSTLVYATASDASGPYDFQGEVMAPMGAGTSHGSIVEFKNKWYVFYHGNSLSNDSKRRSVRFDEISFAVDGRIDRLVPKD